MSAADRQGDAMFPPRSIAERTDALLAETGVDAIIVTSPYTIRRLVGVYLSPLRLFPDEPAIGGSGSAASYVVWGREGRRTLVLPDWLESYARQATHPEGLTIRAWAIEESPQQVLLEVLRGDGLDKGLIGIEADSLPVAAKDRISQGLPDIRFVAVDRELTDDRAQKTEAEIALLQQAASAIELGVIDAIERGSEGMTDQEFATSLRAAIYEHGAHEVSWIGLRWGGPDYASSAEAVAIPAGAVVSFDVGCAVDGYFADMHRTFVVPPAAPDLLDTYARLSNIQRQTMLRLLPGTRISDVYDHYTADMAREGLEKGPWFLGHSIGAQPHEGYYFDRREEREVLPGMVFAIEPEANHAGTPICVEDIVAVLGDGPKILSHSYADWGTMPQLGRPIKRHDDQS